MSARLRFLESAPSGLLPLMNRLTAHRNVKWEVADYEPGDDGREIAPTLADAEAVGSLTDVDVIGERHHALILDIDVPAWLIPSSTSKHSHLYVDLDVPEGDLWDFLDAAVAIGLIESGYASACKSRGMTSLRVPWVRKGEERTTTPADFMGDVVSLNTPDETSA